MPTLPPAPPAVNHLLSLENWSLWSLRNGRKVPVQARAPYRLASPNDADTWSSYRQALKALKVSGMTGIGFHMLDTDVAAIDLDDVRDPKTGELSFYAAKLVKDANSYTEVTWSGRGVRIIGLTSKKAKPLHHRMELGVGQVEYWRHAVRFFVVTFDQLGLHKKLHNIDSVLDKLEAKRLKRLEPIAHRNVVPSKLIKPNKYYLRQAEIKLLSSYPSGDHSTLVWLILMLLIEGGMHDPAKIRDKVLASNMGRNLSHYDQDRLERDIIRALAKKGIAA